MLDKETEYPLQVVQDSQMSAKDQGGFSETAVATLPARRRCSDNAVTHEADVSSHDDVTIAHLHFSKVYCKGIQPHQLVKSGSQNWFNDLKKTDKPDPTYDTNVER